ncbi:MAG TPA: FAD-dependent oxidoreductase [Candidatus Thermoplasmatota archaeon]|nr:FAD-dependent oxidoreductase [Candidatus Thermoplasmatota archaeon]
MYDVVIVGGGPAGSTAAKFLAKQKRKVLLIDKSRFPREKPCGGGLTAKVLKEFPYVKKHDLIESYTYGGYVYAKDMNNRVEIKKDTPIMATVLRKKLMQASYNLQLTKVAHLLKGKK